MARSHGRIMAAIWSDADFIKLTRSAQGMFMFLLSQPDLSHAGLLPMRVNRWAKKAGDVTPKSIRADLDYLADRDFIVVDEETEEVLIRTMVRNDGVYKQPLVMERMREDAKQIESPMLRGAFAAELERLPLDELSTEPSKNDGPSIRERVERVVGMLRDDFAGAFKASREGMDEPLERVTDTPHAGARTSPFPLPPSPIHLPPAEQLLVDESTDRDPLDRFGEFWETYGHKKDRVNAEKKWRLALKKPGVTADMLIACAAAYVLHERSHNEGGRFIMGPAKWLLNERWRDERKDVQAPRSNIQNHLALVEQLAAEEAEHRYPQIGGAS